MLVNTYYDTQAAQADRALHCLSLSCTSRKTVLVCPTRNTLLVANPSPITSFPVSVFRWNSLGCTDDTAILNPLRMSSRKS